MLLPMVVNRGCGTQQTMQIIGLQGVWSCDRVALAGAGSDLGRISMKSLCISTVLFALASTAAPALAQQHIGKCMKPDCESMQRYCDEGRNAGKTDCSTAGKR